jgi:hypothetical protein
MKLLVAIAASLLLFSSATATSLDSVSAPVSPVVLEEGSLAARASGTFTLYTGKSFTGQSTPFAVNTGACNVGVHFMRHLILVNDNMLGAAPRTFRLEPVLCQELERFGLLHVQGHRRLQQRLRRMC